MFIFTVSYSSIKMSVGFIGAGQLAHALVKGFTAAGKLWILAHFILTIRINNIAAIVKITPKVLLRLKYKTTCPCNLEH